MQHELTLTFEDDLPLKEHLNNFVDVFYDWHEKQGYATVKREDWKTFIKTQIQ